jgi:hypothetical protein
VKEETEKMSARSQRMAALTSRLQRSMARKFEVEDMVAAELAEVASKLDEELAAEQQRRSDLDGLLRQVKRPPKTLKMRTRVSIKNSEPWEFEVEDMVAEVSLLSCSDSDGSAATTCLVNNMGTSTKNINIHTCGSKKLQFEMEDKVAAELAEVFCKLNEELMAENQFE